MNTSRQNGTTSASARRACSATYETTAKVVLAALISISISVTACVEDPGRGNTPSTIASFDASGDATKNLRQSTPVTLVLIQTPTECLTCAADTYRWIELARETGGVFLITLSEEPSTAEAAALKRMRLKFTVQRGPLRIRDGVVPPAVVVLRGPDTLIVEGRLTARRRLELLDSARRILVHN